MVTIIARVLVVLMLASLAACTDTSESNLQSEPGDLGSAKSGTDDETTLTSQPDTDPAIDPVPLPDVVPFNMELVNDSPGTKFPAIQGFSAAMTNSGNILAIGGRGRGLHGMYAAPAENMPKNRTNDFVFVVQPATGQTWKFDLTQLPSDLYAQLTVGNAQSVYDASSDMLYIAGGYGWEADGSNMTTMGLLVRFNVSAMEAAVVSGTATADSIAGLIETLQDDRLAVTGGGLGKIGNQFYLTMGQNFQGQIGAFGAPVTGGGFKQKYTESVLVFTLKPDRFEILSAGTLTSADSDQPFHRRDLNVIETVEPDTGNPRISIFGGVFRPGILAAYTNPVHIDSPSQYAVDRTFEQRFNQYEAAVVPVYDAGTKDLWFHIVGGISGYYFHQTPMQKCVRDARTAAGASDGLPFSADVSILHQKSDGTYEEFIDDRPIPPRANSDYCPEPWPLHPERCAGINNDTCEGVANTCSEDGPGQCNDIMGSSVRFIPNRTLPPNLITSRGIVRLDGLSDGQRILAGYVMGSIRSDFAFPLRFGCGTCASDRLLSVYVTKTPSAAYPASYGSPAVNTRGQPGTDT